MQEVGPSIFFSLLVIAVSFLPVFALEGARGASSSRSPSPRRTRWRFAALLAVTLTPALAALVVRGRIRPEERNPLNRWLIALYTPVVRFVVRFRWAVVVGAVVLVLASIPVLLALGSEFMPPLNEGALLYMPTAPPGMSIGEAMRVLQDMDRAPARLPRGGERLRQDRPRRDSHRSSAASAWWRRW